MPPEPARDPRQALALSLLLYAALVALVIGHQVTGYGAISSPQMLAVELHATGPEHPWTLGEKLPYTYRPLFRACVLAVYRGFTPDLVTFYWVFVIASALTLLLAVGAFHGLLRALEFSPRDARLGGILFLIGFPIVFSHDMPIHTREDFLGYAWIALTLIAVARDVPWAVALLGVVGAAIRETCLLGVLPYFLVSRRKAWVKALVYAAPGGAWLALRRLRNPGGVGYDYWHVSTAPLREYPLEALLYLFACFGVLWVAAALRLADRETPPRHPLLAPRVVGLAFLAVALTGWTMGMIREARITYILFPFVIPLALEFFRSERARESAAVPVARLAAGGVLLLGLAGIAMLRVDPVNRVGLVNLATKEIAPPGCLRTYIGTSFNPGVPPVFEFAGVRIPNLFSSPLNGVHVLLNLAATTLLLVGAASSSRARGSGEREA